MPASSRSSDPDFCEEGCPPLVQRVAVRAKRIDRQLDGPLHDLRTQQIALDRREHTVIRRLHRRLEAVRIGGSVLSAVAIWLAAPRPVRAVAGRARRRIVESA